MIRLSYAQIARRQKIRNSILAQNKSLDKIAEAQPEAKKLHRDGFASNKQALQLLRNILEKSLESSKSYGAEKPQNNDLIDEIKSYVLLEFHDIIVINIYNLLCSRKKAQLLEEIILEEYENYNNFQLIEAARIGDIDKAKQLLKVGADINFQHPNSGATALHIACACAAEEFALFLLGYEECNPLLRDYKHRLPSQRAYVEGKASSLGEKMIEYEIIFAARHGIKIDPKTVDEVPSLNGPKV